MQFLNYFFASIISYLGLLIGIILVNTAPEEQKPMEKYFIACRKIFLLMIFAFLIFYYFRNLFYFFTLTTYLVFILFVEFTAKSLLRKSMLAYAILGILFFLSAQNTNLFVIESSLIMLYGMPAASLMYNRREKNYYNIILYNLGFIISANLLYLITTFHFLF